MILSLLTSLTLAAVLPAPPVPIQGAEAAGAATRTTDDETRRVVEAIESGRLREARELLDQLVATRAEGEARTSISDGFPLRAIRSLDEALDIPSLDPSRRAILLMVRGQAAFAAASSNVQKAAMFEEARENFEEAAGSGAGVAAAFRASRAARMMGDPTGALDLARAGARWVDAGEGRAEGLDVDQPIHRTLAEAAFGRYVEVTSAEAAGSQPSPESSPGPSPERAALFAETRDALDRAIGEAPTDTWAYRELANLHLWNSDATSALTALEAALDVAPADEAAHTAFVRVLGDRAEADARAAAGDAEDVDAVALDARFESILARYRAFRATHPQNALGYWYGGFETFYLALHRFENGDHDAALFAEAEALFRGCRERADAYRESCIDYEILARVGAGWSLYWKEDNDGAIRTFFSAEELRPFGSDSAQSGRVAGLDMRLGQQTDTGWVDRLPSALAGLDFVTRRFIADPNDRAALTRAAELGNRMFDARPHMGNLANNAGFLNRDAAVLWERDSRRALRRAKSEAERADAIALRDRADAIMLDSWKAYQFAAEKLSNDVRVVNDAGLVMAYYLRTDADAAEAYFQRSIADGTEQLASNTLDAEARDALNEAWGDAHQNMGIIEMTIRSNPKAARAWLAQALEIGPASRNWLGDVLPLLDRWSESGEKPDEIRALEATTVWVHNP